MKKIVSLALVLVLALAAFALVACDNKENTDPTETTPTETTPTEKTYNLAIGVVVAPSLASAKLTETVATIVTDADGKIVVCRVDCVDYQAKYDDEGALVTTAPASKVALGENYVMPAGSWAEQVTALENFVVGKTQAEVAEVAVNGYAADADLKASCSFNISDLVKAIDNAFKSEHKVTFTTTATAFTAGLNVAGSVKDTADEKINNAKLTVDFCAAILADGKVVAAIVDTAEAELKNITEEGAESVDFKGTKREQGDAYDSYSPMAAGRWYQQVDVFAQSAVGKTAADIDAFASEGVAGCTIYAGGYQSGIAAAVKAAR